MADIIVLTPTPVVVTGAGIVQLVTEAIDVSGYDQLDLAFGLLGVSGAGSITVDIQTSMTRTFDNPGKEPDVWKPTAGTGFTATATGYLTASYPNNNKVLLRFVRWAVTANTFAGNTVFKIEGMARRKC